MSTPSPGTLYLVATPIGNLEDITLRALRILKEVDLIAAEDTRHSRKLLQHFGITTSLTSYHEHNEQRKGEALLEQLLAGRSIALISDAGTPAISDPGYEIVCRCLPAGVPVVPVPGPSAVVTALSAAGLPVDRFTFEGFLPAKHKARCVTLEQLREERRTVVFYEAPHRLSAMLKDLMDVVGGERQIVVARELTKLHEEFFRGTAQEAVNYFSEERVRGEIVVLLAPGESSAPQLSVEDKLRQLQAEGTLKRRDMVKQVAKAYGLPGSEVYRLSLEIFGQDESGEA